MLNQDSGLAIGWTNLGTNYYLISGDIAHNFAKRFFTTATIV